MEKVLIKTLNKHLTKNNILKTYIEIIQLYKDRKEVNLHLYKIIELRKDLRNIKRFLTTHVIPQNINYIKHYYKEIVKVEKEITELTHKMLANEIQ